MRDIILPPIDISHEDFKDKKSTDNNHSLLERVCAAFEDLSLHDHGISNQDVMTILHHLNSEKSYINQKPLIMARTMYFDLWLMINADKLAARDLTLPDLHPLLDLCISNFKGIISVLSPVKYFSSIQKEFTSNESLCHGILEVIFAALKDFIKPTSKIHWKEKIEPYYLYKVFRIFSRVERWVVKLGQAPYEVIHLLNDTIRKVENVSPEIITECAAVLANCTSAPSNRKDMLSTGSLDLIISKFTELSKHADMHNAMACCTEICAALSNFALFDKSASIIVDCGVLDTINSLCISYRKNAALISQACHLFTNISKHLKDKSKVDEFLSIVVNAFYDHQFDEKVILPAINALGSFAFSGVSVSGFKEDLTAFLLKSMDVFDYDTSTQLAALFSISHLAHGDCISIPTFNKCKGMDKIIRAMKQYECFPTVQTAACFAIGTLIRTDKDCRKSLLESNGISLILKAMTKRSLLPEKKENSVVKRVVTAFNVTTPNAQRQNARVSNSVFTTDLMESSSADDLHAVPSNESINTSQRVNGMSRGNSEVSLTDNPPQISNEVGTQEIKPKKLEKDHLILMFACVCLMNLADDEACKKECMRLGAIHYVFIAIKKISEQHSHDLMIVLYTVLNKFFPTGFNDYVVKMKPKTVRRLSEIAKEQILQGMQGKTEDYSLKSLFKNLAMKLPIFSFFSSSGIKVSEDRSPRVQDTDDEINPEEIPSDDLNGAVLQYTRSLCVPDRVKRDILRFRICYNCKRKQCYAETALRHYSFNLHTEQFKLEVFCSEDCSLAHLSKQPRFVACSTLYEPRLDPDEVRNWDELFQ